MSLIHADVAAMTGVSTIKNRNMSGAQYTSCTSGHTMSTNFSGTIRFGKKKDNKKGAGRDSELTVARTAFSTVSTMSLRPSGSMSTVFSRRPSTITTATTATTSTTTTSSDTVSLKRVPTNTSVTSQSSVMTRRSLKSLFKRKRKDSVTIEKERDPITGSIIIRKSSVSAEPSMPQTLAAEPSTLSLQQPSYYAYSATAGYPVEKKMQESRSTQTDDATAAVGEEGERRDGRLKPEATQLLPQALSVPVIQPPTLGKRAAAGCSGDGEDHHRASFEQALQDEAPKETQECLNSEIAGSPAAGAPGVPLDEREAAVSSENDRRAIGAPPGFQATTDYSSPQDDSSALGPTTLPQAQVDDTVPETHAVGILNSKQGEYECDPSQHEEYTYAAPIEARPAYPEDCHYNYNHHYYDYDEVYIPSPPASVKDLVMEETKQRKRKESRSKPPRARSDNSQSETCETRAVEIGDLPRRRGRGSERRANRKVRKHPSLMDLDRPSGVPGTVDADLLTDAAYASRTQQRRRSLPNAILARPGEVYSSKAFNITTGPSVIYLPLSKPISKSSSSFSISGLRMFQSKAQDSLLLLSDGAGPAIITNVSSNSLHSKSSKSTGKASKETDDSTVSSDGTTSSTNATANAFSGGANSGFGGFLKSFRKNKPEMITDTTYRQQLSPLNDQRPEGGEGDDDDGPADGVYPVFKLPLVDAVKFNASFETTDIFARSDAIESQICAIEYQKYVPLIVLKCCKFLVRYGLDEQGLYRVSGSMNEVRRLRNQFVKEGPTFEIHPAEEDIHTVSTLLKLYLRELPDDIFAVQNHPFLEYKPQLYPTAEEEEMDPSLIPIQILQEELANLPFCSFTLLHVLVRHFQLVVEHANKNLMPLKNLAVVFSPTLRIKKSVFIALVSRGDVLWKDLRPVTPRPRMDSIFSNEHDAPEAPRSSPFYTNVEFDFAQMPLPQPPALEVERSPKSTSRPVSPAAVTGQFPSGMSDQSVGDMMYYRRFSAYTEKLTLTKTLSSSVSMRSFSSFPESAVTDPDVLCDDLAISTSHLAPYQPFERGRLCSVDVTNGRTHGVPGYKAKPPRALFLGSASVRHHSYSAPGTPALSRPLAPSD
ncbi:hypothetical protein TRVA0_004S00188 [Trichomonascus vanleenenianus]|uniref:Rho GTPase-activating protein n=1 Tax=Trichomonascus vanleenenianus TaxID=2268995 RepID=UPI003ECA50CB